MNSFSNIEVLCRVKEEIIHYVGGQDRCTWSDAQIEGRLVFNKKDTNVCAIYVLQVLMLYCWTGIAKKEMAMELHCTASPDSIANFN